MQLRRYRKRSTSFVTAVRLDLDTEGLVYRKWGAEQFCKAGDWLVNNEGDTYTVDRDVFERTYREVAPGKFVKVTPIWAEVATEAGSVETLEGRTHYQAGDYVVSELEDGRSVYSISADKFESMYELDE